MRTGILLTKNDISRGGLSTPVDFFVSEEILDLSRPNQDILCNYHPYHTGVKRIDELGYIFSEAQKYYSRLWIPATDLLIAYDFIAKAITYTAIDIAFFGSMVFSPEIGRSLDAIKKIGKKQNIIYVPLVNFDLKTVGFFTGYINALVDKKKKGEKLIVAIMPEIPFKQYLIDKINERAN